MTSRDDSRRYESTLEPLVKRDGQRFILRAPRPGFLRDAPRVGRVLVEGERCGALEVLGVQTRLVVPVGTGGLVVEENEHARLARKPVGYGDVIAVLDPASMIGIGSSDAGLGAIEAGGLTWKTPLGGRYYARPSPTSPPFVEVGAILEVGQSVALIEVMKTFNRASYGGAGLPARARVTAILVEEGDDVNAGDPILAVEPA